VLARHLLQPIGVAHQPARLVDHRGLAATAIPIHSIKTPQHLQQTASHDKHQRHQPA
jgi:hypothetical protein